MPIYLPGRVPADLAVMIATGGDALAHLATLRDQDKLFGPVASDVTAWLVLNRVDEKHLTRMHTVRAAARDRVWAAGAGPDVTAGLVIDIDATITVAHSEKENASFALKPTCGAGVRTGRASAAPGSQTASPEGYGRYVQLHRAEPHAVEIRVPRQVRDAARPAAAVS